MRPMLLLAAALAVAATGCFGGPRRPFGRECLPDSCVPDSHGRCAPSSRECDVPERIVVQGPKTTCIVEQQPCPQAPVGAPPPSPVGTPPPPAPVGVPGPAPVGTPMPIGTPMMPVGGSMMPMMPMMGVGGPSFQAVNAQVKERTGLGFAIDYIRIPIPCIKPIPVTRPSEVTFHMNAQQPTGFAPVGMAGFAPVGMPMAAGFGGVGMVPQATINYGQVTVPTQVPIGQFQQQQQPAGGVGAAPPPKSQQEMLDECMRKLEAAQKKLQELEKDKKEPDKKEPEKK